MKPLQQDWSLTAGEIIFREGDEWDGLYLIKSGNVEIYHRRDSKDIRLDVLGASEFIGTVTVLSRENRSAHARALSDTMLQVFDVDTVNRHFGAAPTWIQGVMRDILLRLKNVNNRLAEVRQSSSASGSEDWPKVLQHVKQVTHLLMMLTRLGAFDHDDKKLVKIDKFSASVEKGARLRQDYVDKIFNMLVKYHLIYTATVEPFGPCLLNPSVERMQHLLEFLDKAPKLEYTPLSDVEKEIMPAFQILAECMAAPKFNKFVPLAQLKEMLNKAMNQMGGEMVIGLLEETEYLKTKGVTEGMVQFNSAKILRTVSFDHIFQEIKHMSPAAL